ncbi:MAG TPA: glycoside hydrolase family 66 protein [Armatimonadota bacterium]
MTRKQLALWTLLLLLALPALGANLSITRVWPDRLVYRPGETATIAVDIANAGGAASSAKVSLVINSGLDTVETLPVQAVTIPAKGKNTLGFLYKVPTTHKWGHQALAAVVEDGTDARTTGSEYFTVGTNPWEVGHYVTVFGLRGAQQSGYIDNQLIPKYRKAYISTVEGYSWQPSVFDGMAPDIAVWRSGQGGYKESKADWQYFIKRLHENGMAAVTYIQCFSYGPYGMDFARRHPELLTYQKDGRIAGAWFDVDQLSAWRENPEAQDFNTPGGITTGAFLPKNEKMGDYWIDQMIKSVEMFGWDGFRSDGNPGITSGYDFKGELSEVKDTGGENTRFLTKVRRRLTERFPNFIFGWNNVAGGYPQMYNSAGEESVMLPNAYSLFEHFRSANEPNSIFHPWKKAVFYLQQEAEAIRAQGGFAHAGWMGSNRYLEAIASACGQQIDTWSGDVKLPNYRRFEFRWSEFLWDTTLRFVRPGSSVVTVNAPAPICWEDFVHTRALPGGGKRVIVHLLNMPGKDDDAWADRVPAPVANVRVIFAPPAGMKLAKIVAISPDSTDDIVPVTPAADGSITLPQVTLWTVVVAEFRK